MINDKLQEATENYAFSIKADRDDENHCLLARKYAFKAGAAWQKENGGINWISVDKELPPINPDAAFGYSVDVLIFDNKTGNVSKGFYCFKPIHGEPSWRGMDNVTHWAIINLPE